MTNRVRSWVLLSVLSLSGCSRQNATAPPELPQSISPGWRLTGVAKLEMTSSPALLRTANPVAAWRATYAGPSAAHVRVWALREPTGLDLAQRWQAQPNTVVVFRERYFAAIDWEGADHADAIALVRGIERALGPPREPR